jgi:hypothetical protein
MQDGHSQRHSMSVLCSCLSQCRERLVDVVWCGVQLSQSVQRAVGGCGVVWCAVVSVGAESGWWMWCGVVCSCLSQCRERLVDGVWRGSLHNTVQLSQLVQRAVGGWGVLCSCLSQCRKRLVDGVCCAVVSVSAEIGWWMGCGVDLCTTDLLQSGMNVFVLPAIWSRLCLCLCACVCACVCAYVRGKERMQDSPPANVLATRSRSMVRPTCWPT